MKKTVQWSVLFAFSICVAAPACKVDPELESSAYMAKPKEEWDKIGFHKIKWKNKYADREICIMWDVQESDFSNFIYPVKADYCSDDNDDNEYWLFHKEDNCLENGAWGFMCLTERSDNVVLFSQYSSEDFTNDRKKIPGSDYYWLREYTEPNATEKTCLTLWDLDDPPWDVVYIACHDEMHAQQFKMVPFTQPEPDCGLDGAWCDEKKDCCKEGTRGEKLDCDRDSNECCIKKGEPCISSTQCCGWTKGATCGDNGRCQDGEPDSDCGLDGAWCDEKKDCCKEGTRGEKLDCDRDSNECCIKKGEPCISSTQCCGWTKGATCGDNGRCQKG